MIYFDNNATTAIDPEVVAEMQKDWLAGASNASSQHALGRSARRRLDDCLDSMLELLSAPEHRFFVTSGGTEANNWVISHLGQGDGSVIVSQIEHPSILEAAKRLEASGRAVRYLPVNADGVIDLDLLNRWLLDDPLPRLVSIMMANNETGVIQPVREIANSCINAGVPLHCDTSQVVGKLPLNIDELGLTAATIAAHKFHGPIGVGGLVLRRGSSISPLLAGGAQQLGYRAGTEPISLVVGMRKAMSLCYQSSESVHAELLQRRIQLENGLAKSLPLLIIHGASTDRLPQTTCFSVSGIDRQALLLKLDFAGIACSTGSACASGSSEPSHVLLAMGCNKSEVDAAVRLSGSRLNTSEEIEVLIDRIVDCCNKLSPSINVDN